MWTIIRIWVDNSRRFYGDSESRFMQLTQETAVGYDTDSAQ